MDFYNNLLDELLENRVKIDSKLRQKQNRNSLLAIVVYSYKNDFYIDLENWLEKYAAKNHKYFPDQKRNFLHMKQDFEKFLKNTYKERLTIKSQDL